MRAFIIDRAVLTGLGAGAEKNVDGILSGRSAIARFESNQFEEDFPVPYGGEVKWSQGGLKSQKGLEGLLDQLVHLSSVQKIDKVFCMIAGIGLSELDQAIQSGQTGLETDLSFFRNNSVIEFLTEQLARRGVKIHKKDIVVIDNTCTSGNCVLGFAAQGIWAGEWQNALAVAIDLVDPFSLVALNGLGALNVTAEDPQKASRPFDKKRNGFVKSDGAAMALVCSENFLREIKSTVAPIEIHSFSQTADAFRLTDGRDDVEALLKAMELAIDRSGLSLKDIHLIKAHGTGTQLNDKHEADAIRKMFYSSGHSVPVTSLKGHLGHVTDASGLVEAVTLGEALCQGVIIPILNCDEPDFDLDFVRSARKISGKVYFMCNTVGFGGNNSSLILSCEGKN